jgi:hypothetical protein
MSDKVEDGGPAFPREDRVDGAGYVYEFPGMTLRDWFAGQALAGLMAYPHNTDTYEKAADKIWTMADAMIAARKGTRDE